MCENLVVIVIAVW